MEHTGKNFEIKARIPDLCGLRTKVAALTQIQSEVMIQRDTFFFVPHGRLKLREFSDGSGEIIFYERPDRIGAKESSYDRCECADTKTVSAVLRLALGVRGVVEKRRELFEVGQSRIHLDEVRGLGTFIEIEVVLNDSETTVVGERIAANFLTVLGIPESALIAYSYIDMLELKYRQE